MLIRRHGTVFSWPGIGRTTRAYESFIGTLLNGAPVGHAMAALSGRYLEITEELHTLLTLTAVDKALERNIDYYWTAFHDARNYIVFGDPAVRLAVR